MNRRSKLLLALGLPALAFGVMAGCGLDPLGPPRGSPSSEQDAAPPERNDSGIPADAAVDAGCTPVKVDDDLSTIDTNRWLLSSSAAGYPAAQAAGDAGAPMVALVAPMTKKQRGGLWLRTPVPTRAFDVTFDYLVACPAQAPCADGVGVAWMNTADPAALSTGASGSTLGLPIAPGGAATISLLKDFSKATDVTPVTLAILQMDAGPPGKRTFSLANDAFVRERRTMTLHLREGVLTVQTDAGPGSKFEGRTTSDFVGYFGFVAATGADVAAAYIASFHGLFYACTP